jgi:GNAT superfamily N-acetyltransferase
MLEPLADRDADAQLWLDCELCSFVENRFHRQLVPDAITPDERTAWAHRAVASDERLRDPRSSEFIAAFWIIDRGVRVGTVALPKVMLGQLFAPVHSLYVFPAQRGTGSAYRCLRALYEASVAAGGEGIRLSTFWTWQTAVRRYLFRYRMWAWSFRRSIDFVWVRDMPQYTVTVDDQMARFSIAIAQGGHNIELLTAAREREVLIWNELPELCGDGLDGATLFHARSTFAVALAVHGWPLLRAGDDLDEVAPYDVGGPDVLARKIAIFEALDRGCGFDVQTPRIPRIPYAAIAQELAADRAAAVGSAP